MTRKVVFVIYPGFQLLGLSGPACAFQIAKEHGLSKVYEIEVVSRNGGEVASSAGVAVASVRPSGGPIDTLIVVGGRSLLADQFLKEIASFVQTLIPRARRIASVCTGSFVLAELGLLDGRHATTHWRHASKLRSDFSRIEVVPDRVFTHDANIWTSAGISAGIDLALALIEDDLGQSEARLLAKDLMVPHRHADGQLHYTSILSTDSSSDRIRRALIYAQDNLASSLTSTSLAAVACLSERQFNRTFRRETGLSVAKAIERLRVNDARGRIEGTQESIESIAGTCGFGDPERMRRAFQRTLGQSPQAIRSQLSARSPDRTPFELGVAL